MLKINQELVFVLIPVMLLLQDMMLKQQAGFKETFEKFSDIIGFEYLKGMHLNDSKKEFGTRVDRHDNIGKGFLGEDTFSIADE